MANAMLQRAQRDDEGRQLDARDQQAVDAGRTAPSRRCRTGWPAAPAGRRSTASLVITMPPSAITMPHDRSMPAVRMISVWPMAMTPTTMTCCRISEKFSPLRKRSLCVAKKTHASSSAMNGPERGRAAAACLSMCARAVVAEPVDMAAPVVGRSRLTSCPSTGRCRPWRPCCRRRPSAWRRSA